MKKNLLLLIVTLISTITMAQVPEDYSISCAGNATEGNYLIYVCYKSKSKKPDDIKLKLAAVHGIIFRGFSSENRGCSSQPPLTKDESVETMHADFFNAFFDKNENNATSFANIQIGSYQITKVKGGYRITAIAVVSKDKLRKHLEDAKVIKALNSGF